MHLVTFHHWHYVKLEFNKIKNLWMTKTKTKNKIPAKMPIQDLCLFLESSSMLLIFSSTWAKLNSVTGGSVWSIQPHMLDTTFHICRLRKSPWGFLTLPAGAFFGCDSFFHTLTAPRIPVNPLTFTRDFWQPLWQCYHVTTTKAALTRAPSH